MTIRSFVRREIHARRQIIMGKVLSQRYRLEFISGGSPMWVADVDIGSERVLRNVPIKTGSDGSVRFADRGQTVALSRNNLGRFDIIGPGDKSIGTTVVTEWEIATGDDTPGTDFGFTSEAMPYSFYRGPATIAQEGTPDFTFTLVGGGNDTLFRSAGSWINESFVAGMYIFISGPGTNTGVFGPIVAPVTAGTLLFAGDVFVNEGPTSDPVIGHTSRWADGQHGYPKVGIFNPQAEEV